MNIGDEINVYLEIRIFRHAMQKIVVRNNFKKHQIYLEYRRKLGRRRTLARIINITL